MSNDVFKPDSSPETISQGLKEGWIVPSNTGVPSFPPKDFSGDCAIAQSQTVAVEILRPLSPKEARYVCDQIKYNERSNRQLLLVLWEGEGWRALGYKSWRECVAEEFQQSQRHCYQLLAAAQVGRNLCAIAQNPDDIPESHLRPLAKLEPELQVQAYQEALAEVGENRRLTGDKVKKVVNRYLASKLSAANGEAPGRKALDYYPTDQRLTRGFIKLMGDKIDWHQGNIIEPCVGGGDIVACLPEGCVVTTNDINPDCEADYHRDATMRISWQSAFPMFSIAITNPPFDGAIEILENAWEHTSDWCIFLLRLSFAEAAKTRRDFLIRNADHLRYFVPVNPRPGFRETPGGDISTVAWFAWSKRWSWERAGYDSPFKFLVDWKIED